MERRRGDELLESLFDATFQLMKETPHTNLTFQQIAEAAKTSRTVLYRRWPTTFDLLQDIYTYKARKLFEGEYFDELKDTGSLRGDFIQLLTVYQGVYDEIGADVMNNYFYIRMQDPDHSRETALHTASLEKHQQAIAHILKNAKARGEKIKKLSKVTLMLPFDLIRMENMARQANISKKRLIAMVDEVLLPVFS
ncbi:TetR/AcrR family transcriptional regulator [Chitinophaga silvisoli]|uniref:TetR/AcrR family transcriptional regulator n=1 Tax=Chitinophaga silvisoli TaxID=2291814 RepID=A0A3E1P084_9BACT|nr:TetR/AcrR family transcriptional regulator [Chitinophaga silvisoli]RFM33593.1 TetR/AcrR family transcriptional regulator [Chitinophaga silvisoli]